MLIVSQNSASVCQRAQTLKLCNFQANYQAIMFLSLSCVSITFSNLYILSMLFSLAASGPGKLQGVRTKPFQLSYSQNSAQSTNVKGAIQNISHCQ